MFKVGHFYRFKDEDGFRRTGTETNNIIADDIQKAFGVFKIARQSHLGYVMQHVGNPMLSVSPGNWLEASEYKYFEEVVDPRASQKKVIDRKGIDLSSVFDKVILRMQQDNLKDVTEDEYTTYVGVMVKSEIRKEQYVNFN